jgi:membrane associated rhomboid family serine protease
MSLWDNLIKKLFVPFGLTGFIALCYVLLRLLGLHSEAFGIHPRDPEHWIGIFTVPLVHANAGHLFGNLLGFVVLSSLLFLVYNRIALPALFLLWVLTGALMFCFARGTYFHIGASGVVYALIFFLFAAGVLVPQRTTLAITLIVGLFYGGSVWGMVPLENGVSWDGHLLGAISGVLVAMLFRGRIARMYPVRTELEESYSEEQDEDDEYSRFNDRN